MIGEFVPLIALVAIAGLTVTRTRAQPASATLIELKYGSFGPNANEWLVNIAKQQGYFRDEGLRLMTISFTAVQDAVTATATRAIQVRSTQADTGIAAIANGAGVRIIDRYHLLVSTVVRFRAPDWLAWRSNPENKPFGIQAPVVDRQPSEIRTTQSRVR